MFETDQLLENIPEEFLSYEQDVRQLNVGQTGKTGTINIAIEKDAQKNKTVITELLSQVPLQVQKALYIEDRFPEMAYIYMMSPSGGILQGDRLKIDINLANNACAHVTTQAATKVYRMKRNYATQMINMIVGDNCYLEFVPDQLIPYRNSRFYQCVNLQVYNNATAVYSEIVTPGRVASGEYFQYDICCLKTIATDQNSRLRFKDYLFLQPKRYKPFDRFMQSKSVFANMYVLTKKIDVNVLSDAVHNMLGKNFINGSASVLPREDGIFARITASTADEIKNVVDTILHKIRNDVLNKPFTGTRKY